MKEDSLFKLVLLEDAKEFLMSLSNEVRRKIGVNIRSVQSGVKDPELFKKMTGTNEIWEFRTLFEGVKYRLLAFWDTDKDTLVIATNGLIKKTQQTPKKEIAKAERLRKQYFENQKNLKGWT